jgi:hypothetical protein
VSQPSRRKRLFLLGGVALLALVLIAASIQQLIYWKTQAGIAKSHEDIARSVAYTQSVAGGQGQLSHNEQAQRVQALTKAMALGRISQCNPDLTPLPLGAPHVITPGTPISQIQCAALPDISARPAPSP